MNYVFLVLKNSIRGLKMSFPVNFRFISGEISAEKFFWKIFIAPKDTFLNFRGSLLTNSWAFVLIFVVMSILEDFDSLLPAAVPARSVAVKERICFRKNLIYFWSVRKIDPNLKFLRE